MRLLMVICLLALSACAQPSGGIDWNEWLEVQTVRGYMRAERSAADAAFSNDVLVKNFRTIAFEVEEDPFGSGPVPDAEKTPPIIRKWQEPIAYRIVNSDNINEDHTRSVDRFMAKLAGLTGLPIERDDTDEPSGTQGTGDQTAEDDEAGFNLSIMILDDADFAQLAQYDRFDRPDWSEDKAASVRSLLATIREWYTAPSPCAGTFYYAPDVDAEDYGALSFGLVMVRADLPLALFDSCVEEELTQMMGLFNDDDDVRPSLFNDINEFALMTDHDEFLLRALYDERLTPGMSPEQAMPLVRQIIAELRPLG